MGDERCCASSDADVAARVYLLPGAVLRTKPQKPWLALVRKVQQRDGSWGCGGWLRAGHALGFRNSFFSLPVYRLTAFPQRLNFFVIPFLRCSSTQWGLISFLWANSFIETSCCLALQAETLRYCHLAGGRMQAKTLLSSTAEGQDALPLHWCKHKDLEGWSLFPQVRKSRRLSMTENLAPVPGTAHSTSDLPNYSQTCLFYPFQPLHCCCEQWSEEVAAVFSALPAWNYPAVISKQDVFRSDLKCLFCWPKNPICALRYAWHLTCCFPSSLSSDCGFHQILPQKLEVRCFAG